MEKSAAQKCCQGVSENGGVMIQYIPPTLTSVQLCGVQALSRRHCNSFASLMSFDTFSNKEAFASITWV